MFILTQDRVKQLLIYDPDTGVFRWRIYRSGNAGPGQITGSLNTTGYIQIKLNAIKYSAHRLAWLYVNGAWPDFDLDHINRNRQDNRISNLRQATRSQNCQNQTARADNVSGVKGVHWCNRKQKWVVQVSVNGKRKHLGAFAHLNDAQVVRTAAEKQYYSFKVA